MAACLRGSACQRSELRIALPTASSTRFSQIASRHSSGALDTVYGRAVLAALALSLIGDVCLLSHKPRPFLIGLTAFLLGHLAYSIAFVVHGQLSTVRDPE